MIASIVLRSTFLLAVGATLIAARRRSSASELHLISTITLAAVLVLPIATMHLPSLPIISLPAALVRAETESTEPDAIDPYHGPSQSDVIWLVWIVGTIICFSRISLAHVRARRIIRDATFSDALSRTFGSSVYLSDDIATAFSYGMASPVVVLPVRSTVWSSEQLHASLLHETAHIARRDGISLCIAQCAVALYWWHPAVWFVARRAAAERERAADDAVLRAGVRPSEYGSHLLAHATTERWEPRIVATALLHHSDGLAPRISSILNTRVDRRPVSPRRTLLACATAIPLIALIAAAAPSYSGLPITMGTPTPSLRAVQVVAQRPTKKPAAVRKLSRNAKVGAGRKRQKTKATSADARGQTRNEDERIASPLLGPMRIFPRLAVQMARLASSLADTTRPAR